MRKYHAHDKIGRRHEGGASTKHLLKVFMLYLALTSAIAGWIDYTSYAVFNPLWMALAALVTAVLATTVHWYIGQRNRVDDIADGDL